MFNYRKALLFIIATITALSLFSCSKNQTIDETTATTSGELTIDIVDITPTTKAEEPSYFTNMDELIEAKNADEDGLFDRFENIPLVNFNSDEYTLSQIGFYPEYKQVALMYTLDNKFVSIIASEDSMLAETDAEVAKTITICGETVDLYQIGLEQYWGQFETEDMHIYLKFTIIDDLESFEQLFEQSTIAEMIQANS